MDSLKPRIAHLLSAPSASDYLLATLLAHAGQRLEDGLVVYWTTPEEVTSKLEAYQPTLCLLWEQHGHMLRAFSGGQKWSLEDRAGYVWLAKAIAPGVKCLATYGPARLQGEAGLSGVTKFHVQKAVREASVAELVVPPLDIEVLAPWHGFTAAQAAERLRLLREKQRPLAHDIEGGAGIGPACYGFADSAQHAVVVPIYDVDGVSVWSEEDEVLITEAAKDLLEDPLVPKIIQNGAYEMFIEAWTTGIVVQGLIDDTMLKHFELYAELEKSLEFQASIYTNQPYWKLDHKEVEGRYVPFKDGRRATTEEWLIYNGTDCCVTYEVNEVMDRQLKPKQREHYLFNVSLLTPFAYMSLRGLRYDKDKAEARLAETEEKIYELQDEINREAAKSESKQALRQFYVVTNGQPMETVEQNQTKVGMDNPSTALIQILTTAFCQARRTVKVQKEEVSWQPYKWNGKTWVKAGRRVSDYPTDIQGFVYVGEGEEDPHPDKGAFKGHYTHWLKRVCKQKEVTEQAEIKTLEDVERFTLDSAKAACKRALTLLRRTSSLSISPAQRGELSTLLNLHININSTAAGGDAQWYLYTHCGFEKQYQMDGRRKTAKLTTDTSALLEIYLKTKDPRVKTILDIRALSTAMETLSATTDSDGRIRNSYNIAASNTGRVGSNTSNTGSGFSLHTVTKRDKDLFLADEGKDLYSPDLSGADSWTCAAHAARMGDSTMLADLLGKLKPAKIVALMQLFGTVVNNKEREELKVMSKEVPEEGGLYPASKATTHGSNYGMKPLTMARNILKQSYKKTGTAIVVSPSQCSSLQSYYFTRYPGILKWQADVKRQLKDNGILVTPFGFSRKFFGRKDDQGTLRDALSFEPQANTTYVTNSMLLKMWVDPENRLPDGSLVVEPLHQIHDAAVFQGPEDKREWIKAKVAQWFHTPLVIGGTEILIPYECGRGKNWKKLGAL